MKRFSVNYACENMLYTTNKVELESCFRANCEFCARTCNRDCSTCRAKSTYEGLRMGFEIAEERAAKRDIVRAK